VNFLFKKVNNSLPFYSILKGGFYIFKPLDQLGFKNNFNSPIFYVFNF
tara:strand:+ start:57 stop:200 length:144 start_codon:yes stop_codon:yes gene_type:complete